MAKKLNVIGIVFTALAAVGLVLAIVGMCTGVVSVEGESITLFDEGWDAPGMPGTGFAIVAFIVALIGALIVLVHGVLGFVGKDIKILGLVGGAVAILGGILVLVAGLMLASDINDLMNLAGSIAGSIGMDVPEISVNAGVGVWVGTIGGVIAGVAGLLNALKVGQKA